MNLLFVQLFDLILKVVNRFTVKQIIIVAVLASFQTMVSSAFFAYLDAYDVILRGLNETMPNIVIGVWGWIMPPNVHLCIMALFSATALKFSTKIFVLFMVTKWNTAARALT